MESPRRLNGNVKWVVSLSGGVALAVAVSGLQIARWALMVEATAVRNAAQEMNAQERLKNHNERIEELERRMRWLELRRKPDE